MRLSQIARVLPLIYATANAAPADDMEALRTSCENAANVLNSSLNQTAAVDTSSIVQRIGWQVGASTANLGNSSVRSKMLVPVDATKIQQSSSPNGNKTSNLDNPYFDYVDSLGTLAEATSRRGRIIHKEANLPVYNALQGLATAMQSYDLKLSNAGMVSQDAFIRTLTAGSQIVDAELAWANNGNQPGRKRSLRRRSP